MIEESKELLPCPFCAGEAEIIDQVDMNNFGDCRIMCTACRARGDTYTDEDGDRVARSRNAWNIRARPMEIVYLGRMDELKKQLTAKQQALDSAVKALKDFKSDIEVQVLDMGDFTWIPTVEYEQAIERLEAALAAIKE